jgi:flagellar hook protein FlgE
LQFNANGLMTSPDLAHGSIPVTVSGLSDGASSLSMSWDLYDKGTGSPKFTQFSEASGIASNSQNGQPAAERTGVTLSDDGKIIATYSNGAQQQIVSQLALASIRNPDSLVDVGLNNFSLGADTAPPAIGTAGTGGRGAIDGGSLEGSTVDIASEFSNLLVYQRSYQADSRVVTVSDSLAQEAVNLIHS